MSEIASIAAGAFCEKYDPATYERDIKIHPQDYLQHTVPYITVRTLHHHRDTLDRQEKALKVWKLIQNGLSGLR